MRRTPHSTAPCVPDDAFKTLYDTLFANHNFPVVDIRILCMKYLNVRTDNTLYAYVAIGVTFRGKKGKYGLE